MQNKLFFLKRNSGKLLLSLTFAYLLFICLYILHYKSLVPDEIHFLEVATQFKLLHSGNPDYFGQIFWGVLSYINNPLYLRILYLFFFVTPVLFYLVRLSKISNLNSFCFLLLYISMPFSFWTGKLIGPELLNYFLIFLALALIIFKRNYIPFLLMGICIGIKFDAIAVLLPFFYVYYNENRCDFNTLRFIRLVPFQILLIIFGFILANPYSYNDLLIKLFFDKGSISVDIFNNIKLALYKETWTWDAIQCTGFFRYIISIPSFVLLLLYTFIFDKKIFVLLTAIFLIPLAIIVRTEHAFIWYFFNTIPFFLYIFFKILTSNNYKPKQIYFVILFTTISNFIFLSNTTIKNLSMKFNQISNINNVTQNKNLIVDNFKIYKPNLVINFSDVNIDKDWLASVLAIDPSCILSDRRNSTSYFLFVKLEDLNTIDKVCKYIQDYDSIAIVLSRRFIKYKDVFFSDFHNWIINKLSHCGSLFTVNKVSFDGIDIYNINNQLHVNKSYNSCVNIEKYLK